MTMRPDNERLGEAVRGALGADGRVGVLQRIPCADRVERLTLAMPDGKVLFCIWKRSTLREARLYRRYLTPARTGAPRLMGLWLDHEERAPWLFLEELGAPPIDFTSAAAVTDAYHHLAAMHHRFRGAVLPLPTSWHFRKVRAVLTIGGLAAELINEMLKALCAVPPTLVHGDYHRWNLLRDGARVRVLDWEHATRSHPLWDLLLLAPEESGPDAAPLGKIATLALRAYHEAGPLSYLPWYAFLRLQRTARLYRAHHRCMIHTDRACGALSPGAAAVISAHADRERQRAARLLSLLHDSNGGTVRPRPLC
jgi:hypothetical protein